MEEIIDAIENNTIMELHNKIRGNNIIVVNKKNLLFWDDNTKLWIKGSPKMIVDDMISYFGKNIQDEISKCTVNEYKKMGQYTNLFSKLDEMVENKYEIQYIKKYENSDQEDKIDDYNIGIPIQNKNFCDYVNGIIRERTITDYYTKEHFIPQQTCNVEEIENIKNIECEEDISFMCKYLIKYKGQPYIKVNECFTYDKNLDVGFIYIIRPWNTKKMIPLSHEIYKIGRSSRLCNRMHEYGENLDFIFCLLCEKNLALIEREIISELKNDTEIIHEKSYGLEYFSGNVSTIINKIIAITKKNDGFRNYKEDIKEWKWFGTNIDDDSITSVIQKEKLKNGDIEKINNLDI